MTENKELKIVMLGTGCPRPEISRSGPAQVVFVDELPILVDCGEGTTDQLMKAGIAPEEVNHLWFTHLHSDHTFGYAQFLLGGWELGRRELTVVGPKGTKKFHDNLLAMYDEDISYRLSAGRPQEGLLNVKIIEIEKPGLVESSLPVRVTAEEMVHSILTYAFRFEVDSKAIVISGDTAPTDSLVKLAQGADILVHDCCLVANSTYYPNHQDPEKRDLWNRISQTHCTPSQAGDTARLAGVKTLVLTHLFPKIDVNAVQKEAEETFTGTVIVPDDLQAISVEKKEKQSIK
ncbi:MBL fold metallo-hydrolase [Sporosarcina sp. ACRSM]|uniref:MBL fold metallo-hydrolase n=1 Tax=Sporosarcina sp. ACRSM TaxID=2918216 RepID=UPI001EF7418B|nr:MBL fold metallo-hydrolase [Sporosarcina sp. ACRSM]MCG7335226.1 MBL fold metallo-hydrolase [Sporosarcina sp. ACRSM]